MVLAAAGVFAAIPDSVTQVRDRPRYDQQVITTDESATPLCGTRRRRRALRARAASQHRLRLRLPRPTPTRPDIDVADDDLFKALATTTALGLSTAKR